MSYRKISQHDARRYKRELENLQRQTRHERSHYGGVHLRTITVGSETAAVLKTAKDLGHPLALKLEGCDLHIYGVR